MANVHLGFSNLTVFNHVIRDHKVWGEMHQVGVLAGSGNPYDAQILSDMVYSCKVNPVEC